jgi:energy-coupling factor transporter transmembrane protein EcfT
MHSGLLVFLWLVVVASLQFLDVGMLSGALCLLVLLGVVYAPARSWRLVRRVRFIVLAIVILFAGFTPGEALLVDWPRLSPSREGMSLAYEHAARVVVVVLLVSLLLEHMPSRRLIGAIHALMRPFGAIGFPADRVAVRTLLVLRLVEAEKPPKWHEWISDDCNDLHEMIEVDREPFRMQDRAVIGLLGLVLTAAVWWWFS